MNIYFSMCYMNKLTDKDCSSLWIGNLHVDVYMEHCCRMYAVEICHECYTQIKKKMIKVPG